MFDLKEGICRSHHGGYCNSASCFFLFASPHLINACICGLYELICTPIDLEGMDWGLNSSWRKFPLLHCAPSHAWPYHKQTHIGHISVWVQFHLQGRVSWPHHGRYCPRHCYGEPRRHRRVGCRKATSVLRVGFYQDPESAQPAGQRGDRHWELEKWDGDSCGQSWTNWG